MLTKEIILSSKPATEVVDVPEWGGQVLVRALPASVVAEVITEDGDFMKELIPVAAQAIVDENGERLFSDDDYEALGRLSFSAIERVARACLKLSKVNDEEFEELGKGSDDTP